MWTRFFLQVVPVSLLGLMGSLAGIWVGPTKPGSTILMLLVGIGLLLYIALMTFKSVPTWNVALLIGLGFVLELHEIKGQRGWKLDDEGRTKWKVAGEKFPWIRMVAQTKLKGGGWATEVYQPRAAWPRGGSSGE